MCEVFKKMTNKFKNKKKINKSRTAIFLAVQVRISSAHTDWVFSAVKRIHNRDAFLLMFTWDCVIIFRFDIFDQRFRTSYEVLAL